MTQKTLSKLAANVVREAKVRSRLACAFFVVSLVVCQRPVFDSGELTVKVAYYSMGSFVVVVAMGMKYLTDATSLRRIGNILETLANDDEVGESEEVESA